MQIALEMTRRNMESSPALEAAIRKHAAKLERFVALRDAFRAAVRRLEDRARLQRRDVKTHETPAHGRIADLFPDMACGEIESSDGRRIYFHRNRVVNENFDRLETGTEIRFAEKTGNEGPQASTVTVLGKHHVVG